MFGQNLDYNTDCRISYGSYVEASPDYDITNTMDTRTVPCIALGTTGNMQGSLRVFDLNSGKVLVRCTAKEMPFPSRVLKRVNDWGRLHGSAHGQKLVILNRKRLPISTTDDEVGKSPLTSNKVHPDILYEFPGITTEEDSYQQTVVWHVDDHLVSHIDPVENTKFALHFGELYNKEALNPITVNRGKFHDYLGVDFGFDKDGEVTVSQINYVQKILDDFPKEISGPQASPAAQYLFDIRPDDDNNKKLLSETQSESIPSCHCPTSILMHAITSRYPNTSIISHR